MRSHGQDGGRPEDVPPGAFLLVAEDTPVSSTLMVELLKRRGYKADAVPDGAAAVEAFAKKAPYAAILMDIQMPGMDGYEATKEIRRLEPAGSRVPIIAVTAHVLKVDRERAFASGMDDFIPKPVRAAELDRVLDRWLAPAPPREPDAVAEADGPLDQGVLDDLRTIEREGGAEIVASLLEAFIEETPRHLEALRRAAVDGDAPAFKRTAHTLGGVSRSVGARRAGATCLELEDLANAGDLGQAETPLSRVHQEWAEAKSQLALELPDSYPQHP